MANVVRVHLRSGHVQPLWAGHPWVFAQAIARMEGTPSPGEEVLVLDPRGNAMGRGFYTPESAIPVRLLSRGDTPVDEKFLAERVREAVQWRKSLCGFPSEETSGFRLIHAEGDRLPGLIVDAYGSVLAVQLLTVGMKKREKILFDALLEATGASSIVEVASERHQRLEGFSVEENTVRGPRVETLSFTERGFRWDVGAPGAREGGQKTGFFFDQRPNRARVETLSKGKRVLDLYTYAGGFALGAARSGATRVVAVDSSAAALDRGRFAAEKAGLSSSITWIKEDVRNYTKVLLEQKEEFDVVVCDPPKLAPTSKDLERARSLYRWINAQSARLLSSGGVLATFSCSQAMTSSEFLRTVAAGIADAGKEGQVLEEFAQGLDHPVPIGFPEGRYLKGLLVRVSK